MPLTVSSLQTKLLDIIAPGDSTRFLRLLQEADDRLLEFGRWNWTRSRATITPVNGLIQLPEQFSAIIGARLGSLPRPIHTEEFEFVPDGIGEVPVTGCIGVGLIDQGYLTVPGTDMFLDFAYASFSSYEGPLIPTAPNDGRPAWSSDGALEIGETGFWARCYYNSESGGVGQWLLSLYDDGLFQNVWTITTTELSPYGLTWVPALGFYGALTTTPSDSTTARTYKLGGEFPTNETVTALVRFAPSILATGTDMTRCPDYAALKLMMLAINFEEENDIERSRSYVATALRSLDNKEKSHRSGAKHTFTTTPWGSGISGIRRPR